MLLPVSTSFSSISYNSLAVLATWLTIQREDSGFMNALQITNAAYLSSFTIKPGRRKNEPIIEM